jgi:transposase
MLCSKCDASRFPMASVQNNNTNTKKMSPSAKAKTASESKQLNSADSKSDVTDASDYCDNIQTKTIFENTVATNTTSDDRISSLRAEIRSQRELISQLQQQLRSVLSILGITEHDIQQDTQLINNHGSEVNNKNTAGNEPCLVDQQTADIPT